MSLLAIVAGLVVGGLVVTAAYRAGRRQAWDDLQTIVVNDPEQRQRLLAMLEALDEADARLEAAKLTLAMAEDAQERRN